MKLTQILTAETQTLKAQFIEFTKTWANSNYPKVIAFETYTALDWCNYFNLTPEYRKPHQFSDYPAVASLPRGFYNTKQASKKDRLESQAYQAQKIGLKGYIAKAEANAETHYNTSIEKLALRIEKKGLDLNNLEVKTSHIGVNIDTELTDGVKTVRAFTIVASGEIQRPHYRYLIK